MTSVSIVGGGPVGLMMACLLSPWYYVTVYEKRSSYQRLHELDIGGDVIGELMSYCNNSVGLKDLVDVLNRWKNSSITTAVVEQELKAILDNKRIAIVEQEITSPNELNSNIIIGCDGAHSAIRKSLHLNVQQSDPYYTKSEVIDTQQWGYLLSMRFSTAASTTPRKIISGLIYNIPSAMNGLGLDHESFHALSPTDQSRKVSLYLPISAELYQQLSGDQWTIAKLKQLGPSADALINHLERYRLNLELRGGWISEEAIKVLPLTGYRAASVSYVSETNTAFLVGDSSSGLVYRRGLKKGWKEACYLATQLMDVRTGSQDIDDVGVNYQRFCIDLYRQETAMIDQTQQRTENVNTGLALAGIGALAFAAIGLAVALRR